MLFLWTVYAGAPADSPMQDEALESFTEGFVGAFDGRGLSLANLTIVQGFSLACLSIV
jgi:hypothetical protein